MQDVGKYKEIYGIEEGEGIYTFFYKSRINTCSSSQHVRVNNENIFCQTGTSMTIEPFLIWDFEVFFFFLYL